MNTVILTTDTGIKEHTDKISKWRCHNRKHLKNQPWLNTFQLVCTTIFISCKCPSTCFHSTFCNLPCTYIVTWFREASSQPPM